LSKEGEYREKIISCIENIFRKNRWSFFSSLSTEITATVATLVSICYLWPVCFLASSKKLAQTRSQKSGYLLNLNF